MANAAGANSAGDQSEGLREAKAFASQQQLDLLGALHELSPRLARMYEGALRVFAQESNPECFAQAALSIREVFDKLHLATKQQPPPRTVSMRTKANQVRDAWQRMIRTSQAFKPETGRFEGEVNGSLGRFLGVVGEFIAYLAREVPFRRDELDRILGDFDPAPGPVPLTHAEQRRSTFETLDDYMNNVTHHNFEPKREDFGQKLAATENFLRDLIQPRVAPKPFEDRAALDALLGEDTDAH